MPRPAEYVKLYKFPPGRMAFALGDTARRAASMADPAPMIVPLVLRGVAASRDTLQLESRYRALHVGRGQYPKAATGLDQHLDQGLHSMDGYLQSQASMFAAGPRGKSARRVMQALYPEGIVAITRLPFSAEHERVEVLLATAADPELADDVAALPDLPAMLAEINERNDAYGDVLRQAKETPTGDAIRDARAECQDLLGAVVGLIVGLFELHAPDRTADRDDLLEPIRLQNEAIRRARRGRSVPTDTDPDTGAEFDDSDLAELEDELDGELEGELDGEFEARPEASLEADTGGAPDGDAGESVASTG